MTISSTSASHQRDQQHSGGYKVGAVLFDMDGVITDTAEAHAHAWKRLFDEFLDARDGSSDEDLRPFDPEEDYLKYVDGKPRYEGVKSFLSSRGIDLPDGTESDDPDKKTVCGLGNRKNDYFNDWLNENRVKTYPGSIALVHNLKDAGIKVAVFSSSRNAEAVLDNAGVLTLFDAKVDGVDLHKLKLPGKPDPASLREAAKRLNVPPERAVVVEDAIAGVRAATHGGFALAIGIDRGGNRDALAREGADVVVDDLAEVAFDRQTGIAVKKLSTLPPFHQREDAVRSRLSGQTPVVFLDYDGTLTPIVEDPAKAVLSSDMREALSRLSERSTVAIVSGRDVDTLRDLIGLDTLYYAGSHGFEIAGPEGWDQKLEKGVEFLPEIDAAQGELRDGLADIPGHAVERKRFSIAVHYRRAADEDVAKIEKVVDKVLSRHGGLRKAESKKVFRLQPNIDWSKGHAVLWLLEKLDLDHDGALPIYVGDDLTDEDAFRALAGRGLTLAVCGSDDRPTAADYSLSDPDAVKRFLEFLAAPAEGSPGRRAHAKV